MDTSVYVAAYNIINLAGRIERTMLGNADILWNNVAQENPTSALVEMRAKVFDHLGQEDIFGRPNLDVVEPLDLSKHIGRSTLINQIKCKLDRLVCILWQNEKKKKIYLDSYGGLPFFGFGRMP